jgi:hypothetical protein
MIISGKTIISDSSDVKKIFTQAEKVFKIGNQQYSDNDL